LALAEAEGAIRLFVDQGPPMARLLAQAAARGIAPDTTARLLAAFAAQAPQPAGSAHPPASGPAQPLIEPLSERELDVLRLIAQGLSNQAIGERLFLALDTVKGHNRHIFDKLQVQRRTEAVARARELGLL
jgi:LuxR family maltose regulon positive regulatory protein